MSGAATRLADVPGRGSGLPARPREPGRGMARPWQGADRVSTPGRLRRMLAWLIVATLAWGGLATFTALQHTSGAGTVVSASEPLTYDALAIWQSLSDANDTAGAAVLSGALPQQKVLGQYTADINKAKLDIADAAARGAPMSDIDALQAGLTSYTDEVSKAQANDLLGYPVGAGYFRQASQQMIGQLLPVAHDLYTTEDARLATASAQATGLPLIVVTILAGIALGYAYYRSGRWLTRRTHRVLNGGLALAAVIGVVALLWLAGAFLAGRADLLASQAQGSTPVMALANADIAALKAHTDEALTLINNSGDDINEVNQRDPGLGFQGLEKELGPGPGTLLAQAQSAAAGSPAAGDASDAVTAAPAWFAAHKAVRLDDDGVSPQVPGGGTHQEAVTLVLSGSAGSAFTRLSGDLSSGITADDRAFASNASSGQGAFTGLVPGIIVATLVMVAGLVWGLSRRLAEYR